MDILLIVLGSICLLLGLVGCLLPVLPGPPLAYAGMLLLHFTERVQFTTTQLLVWLGVVILVQLVDYFIPMMGTKKLGGTKWGTWGCLIGTIAGIFIFPPWGIILGPFVGAVLGELLGGKETQHALRAGFGAFMGFMLGTIFKFAVCGWFIFVFIRALV
ncbi:MAG: DUF456 domain-containing protein [Bacteroides sp.]|nr:DUF456 domain-containing protein [Bacteroides sp.]